MKAVGYRRALPISDPDSLLDLELPDPVPGPRDLRVQVRAVSVNPADTKFRASANPPAGEVRILGYDAAGVVQDVGREVSRFHPGDRVWYAGSMARQGTDSELHLVDERITGRMPHSLEFGPAAAMPLTTLTASELLFDRLEVLRNPSRAGDQLLVIGATGGVGSILVQLARKLTPLTVIGTASTPEGSAEVRANGAHHVVDYHNLPAELQRIGIPGVAYVASLTHTDTYIPAIAEVLVPAGRLGLIDDPASLDMMALKPKCISTHWEFMFSRSLFQTPDMDEQGKTLDKVAELVDAGALAPTRYESYGKITAENLRRAHADVETGHTHGKVVLVGF